MNRRSKTTHLPSWHVLHDLLLARQRGLFASVRVAVRLGEQQWHQVNARPGSFALELSVRAWEVKCQCESCWTGRGLEQRAHHAAQEPPLHRYLIETSSTALEDIQSRLSRVSASSFPLDTGYENSVNNDKVPDWVPSSPRPSMIRGVSHRAPIAEIHCSSEVLEFTSNYRYHRDRSLACRSSNETVTQSFGTTRRNKNLCGDAQRVLTMPWLTQSCTSSSNVRGERLHSAEGLRMHQHYTSGAATILRE